VVIDSDMIQTIRQALLNVRWNSDD